MVEARPGTSGWRPEQIPLLVLAMYHIVVGYFTIAPLYKDLAGADLTTSDALAQQTQLLIDISKTLFETPSEGESGSES